MKTIIFTKAMLFGVAVCLNATAQPWNKNLQGSTASSSEEVIKSADGNYVFVGTNGTKMYVVKTDMNGNIIWQKDYGSTYGSGTNKGYTMCQLNDGNYVIGGQFTPNVVGATDIGFLLKIDATGNPLIARQFVNDYNCFPCPQPSFIKSVRATNDGGFIACGRNGDSFPIGAIYKCDANLNITWSKYYISGGASEFYSIEKTSDGGYIVCGQAGGLDVLKIDASGNLMWWKRYSYGGFPDLANSIKQTTDGGYIFSGYSSTLGGSAFVIKTDANGNLQWQSRIISSTSLSSYSVLQTNDLGYAIGVYSTVNSYPSPYPAIVKLQSNGILSWTKSYMGSINRLMQTSDSHGAYLVATGSTTAWSLTPGIYMFKTDENGVNCISQDVTVSINGQDISNPTTPSFSMYAFTPRYSPYTPFSASSTLTLNSNCCIADAGIDKSNSYNICCIPTCSSVQIGTAAIPGYTYSWSPTTGLSCSNCAQPNASPCSTTIYTVTASAGRLCAANTDAVKITNYVGANCCNSPVPVRIGFVESSASFDIFPNPTTGEITIELHGNNVNFIQIIDLTGRIIYENKNVSEKTFSIDLSKQSKGIYLIKATTDSDEIIRKITLE